MTNHDQMITPFVCDVANGEIEIYNEYSLQHELGIFFRKSLPQYKVQFERNVDFFFPCTKASFIKKEIDISIYLPEQNLLEWAIELKFPRNGQYPEQMYSFCKDIVFAEQLKSAGFKKSGLMIFADDKRFYEGASDGIYGFFRTQKQRTGTIQKPTGKKDSELKISGKYNVNWQDLEDPLKYTIIEAV